MVFEKGCRTRKRANAISIMNALRSASVSFYALTGETASEFRIICEGRILNSNRAWRNDHGRSYGFS